MNYRLPPSVQRLYGQRPRYPSYQEGGMVGLGGIPEGGAPMGAPMGAPASAPMPPDMINMELQRVATQHPQEMQMMRSAMMQAMQTGKLTPQELNTLQQLATAAVQNPASYPQIRQFAIQQGIADEEDLPQEYNQGLLFMLLLAAQSVQGAEMPAAPPPPPPGTPSMQDGGTVPQSRRRDGSVTIDAHEGEYVIPANVVKMKGREFFDNLLEKYKDVT